MDEISRGLADLKAMVDRASLHGAECREVVAKIEAIEQLVAKVSVPAPAPVQPETPVAQ